MRLRSIAPIISLAFLNPFSAFAQDTKTAKIEELLKLTNAEGIMQQVYSQIRTMTAKQVAATDSSPEAQAAAAQVSDKLIAQIQERLSWAKMKPEYVRLYDEVYTDEEITGILTFYKSPAGQAFLTKMPQLMTKMMEVAQRQMLDLAPEIQRTIKESAGKGKSDASQK